MVNPTGYTALDLIGFTDKGAYLSSENYVKNDLVHYSGNIWRCLIDDTSGIAPAEGVNWTLFIGEPTNLVERIIAPVETDPATSAWAVGRQIIYNDNLYEVIVAITAGDALVAYEDDPTNANIKLADPVETQLLNVKGNLTNRNLLDNAWFTVNQRGQASYNTHGSIGYDRWRFYYSGGGSVSKSGSVVALQSTGSYVNIVQRLEDTSDLVGKTLTFSMLMSDGTIKSGSALFDGESVTFYNEQNTLSLDYSKTTLSFRIVVYGSRTISFKAVKLELGSISTLAMDTAPNYAEELLKCQRYFTRLSPDSDSAVSIAIGFAVTANDLRIEFSLPLRMRAVPGITYSNLADFRYTKTTFSDGSEPTAIGSAGGEFGSAVVVKFSGTFTASDVYEIYVTNAGYIDLSAEL